jgi:hypothetical protein
LSTGHAAHDHDGSASQPGADVSQLAESVQEQPSAQDQPSIPRADEVHGSNEGPQYPAPEGRPAAQPSAPDETIVPEADSVLQAAADIGDAMADLALVLQVAAKARGPPGSTAQLGADPSGDSWAAIRSAHSSAVASLRNAKRTLSAIGVPPGHQEPPGVSVKRRAKTSGVEKRRSIPRIGTVNATIAAMKDRPAIQLKALCAIISANSDPYSTRDLLELQQVARVLWQSANAFSSRMTPNSSESPAGSLAGSRGDHLAGPRPLNGAFAAEATPFPSGIDIPVESTESSDEL